MGRRPKKRIAGRVPWPKTVYQIEGGERIYLKRPKFTRGRKIIWEGPAHAYAVHGERLKIIEKAKRKGQKRKRR